MQEDLITAIYDAPLAQQPWAGLLPMLRDTSRAAHVMLKFAPACDTKTSIIITDRDADRGGPADLYRAIYQYKDPVDYRRVRRGELCQFDDLIDRDMLVRSEFYRNFCHPLAIEHAFFCYIGRYEGVDAWLNGCRDAEHGRFSGDEMESIQMLLPHLARAAQIYCRMEHWRSQALFYSDVVSAMGVGVVLLDRRGAIVDTNAQAETILASAAPVERSAQRLLLGAAQDRFAGVLKSVLCEASVRPHALSVTSECGRTLSVMIRRMEDLGRNASAYHPLVAVYMNWTESERSPAMVDFVADALSLTKAEALLAVLLSDGHTLRIIAGRMGVTETTARTYCKRILAKTGVSRQIDLVRMVTGSLARLA